MPHKFRRLDDKQWNVIVRALKASGGNLSSNTRDHVDGILFLMQHDLPWRDLDPEFGKWNSVYVRFMRWTEKGVLDGLVTAFQKLGLTDRWNTEWVEYSRSQGAKSAPTKREIIARNVVEGAATSLKDEVSSGQKHNFSKPKASKITRKTGPTAQSEPAAGAGATPATVTNAIVRSRKQPTALSAIRERRERRRQLSMKF